MLKLKAGIAIAALALLTPMAQAAGISNGGFESSNYSGQFDTVSAGGSLGAWNVVSGSVDLINTYWTNSEGHYSLDLNGTQAGSIQQAFATVVGQTYTVSFDVAGNANGGGNTKILSMGAGSYVGALFIDTTGKSNTNMGWTTKSFDFVANSSTSILSFSGFAGNGAYGVALDNVKVTAAVPEPETYGMLLAGLGLVGLVARRKKQAK
ncbi:choice-of-anchor C family protein [Duganella fentianensis]|uniref:choice-of-anchor C family PEP-CTERM protein n=1 Tax=Duganella fentianensis TaxID=2692177 RepID=UPI0032B2D6E2